MIRALELLGRMQTRARTRQLASEKDLEVEEEPIAPRVGARSRARGRRRTAQSAAEVGSRDSPYFTPRKAGMPGAPPTPLSPPDLRDATSPRPRKRKRRSAEPKIALPSTPDRARAKGVVLPPTPESLPRPERRRLVPIVEIPETVSKNVTEADKVIAPNEQGVVEAVDKILLLQERVRVDPWKLLIATSLLNKTSGRAVKPIYWELLRRYPTPESLAEASVPDLTDLIYPLGLFNQRASSLIRMSQQYLALAWPRSSDIVDLAILSAVPFVPLPTPALPDSMPEELDAKVFYGAGVYASDSFRIYSSWLPGRGGPEKEEKWLGKRRRAIARFREARGGDAEEAGDVEEVGGYLSDEEGSDGDEEWRTVRPLDKELRRYLIWRWGLEGITYDILRGPVIKRQRDRRRLSALLGG